MTDHPSYTEWLAAFQLRLTNGPRALWRTLQKLWGKTPEIGRVLHAICGKKATHMLDEILPPTIRTEHVEAAINARRHLIVADRALRTLQPILAAQVIAALEPGPSTARHGIRPLTALIQQNNQPPIILFQQTLAPQIAFLDRLTKQWSRERTLFPKIPRGQWPKTFRSLNLKDALTRAGYSAKQARKGRAALSGPLKQALVERGGRKFARMVELGRGVNVEDLRLAVLAGIALNIAERTDKGTTSLKLAGSLKELKMFDPENLTGIIVFETLAQAPTIRESPRMPFAVSGPILDAPFKTPSV